MGLMATKQECPDTIFLSLCVFLGSDPFNWVLQDFETLLPRTCFLRHLCLSGSCPFLPGRIFYDKPRTFEYDLSL